MSDITLTEYGNRLFGEEEDLLRQMREEATREGLPAIQVPTDVGRLLQVLITQLQARRVLEIGTLFGYSTVLMARAMPADGRLTTLEVNPKHADLARRNIERAGVAEKVRIILGPGSDTLVGLQGETFDLVFIDADKEGYPEYLKHALRLTKSGSLIVTDNVWRGGAVVHPSGEDTASAGAARFNQALASESRLVSALVPSRGGEDATSVSVVR